MGILSIKHEFPNNMPDNDLILSIRDRCNGKFTDSEIAEILRLEKLYMKELEYTFINPNTKAF